MTNEKPLLFSPAMREALQEGRKIQTRRVVKNPPPADWELHSVGRSGFANWVPKDYDKVGIDSRFHRTDYSAFTGDRLWVKEAFYALGEWLETSGGSNKYSFARAKMSAFQTLDMPVTFLDKPPKQIETGMIPGIVGWYKRPSIFLPRKDSRINLEITDFRVERVQDISKADCIAEGMTGLEDVHAGWHQSYAELWDSINEKRGFGWDANPWVWVITFRRI